jgi:hypothetical protein
MDEPGMSTEAALAVLNTKVDQLIELNKTRGEDHEKRLRALETERPNYITKRAAYSFVALVATVTAAGTNFLAYLLK